MNHAEQFKSHERGTQLKIPAGLSIAEKQAWMTQAQAALEVRYLAEKGTDLAARSRK